MTKKNYGIVAVIVLSRKEKVENSFKRPNLAPDTRTYALCVDIYDKILYIFFSFIQTTAAAAALEVQIVLICNCTIVMRSLIKAVG